MDFLLAKWKLLVSIAGGLATIAAFIILPVQAVAWAEGMVVDKLEKTQIEQKAKTEYYRSEQRAAHNYDFYGLQAKLVNTEIIFLEELEVELHTKGKTLTRTQLRTLRKLEAQVVEFEKRRDKALKQLKDKDDVSL